MTDDDVLVTDTLQIAVSYGDSEVYAINDIWFHSLTGAIDAIRGKAAATAVNTWHKDNVMPYITNEAQSFNTIAVDRTYLTGHVWSSFPAAQVNGGMGVAVPFVCVMRIDFQTGLDGVWYKGKNFISGLPESVVTKSHIDATWAENVRSAYDLLPAVAASLDCEWVVTSRRFGGAFRAEGLNTPITSAVLPDLRVRTYRQRIARYGT